MTSGLGGATCAPQCLMTDFEAIQDGIPEKVVQKALKGECINLKDFIDNKDRVMDDTQQIVESHGSLVIKAKRARRSLNDFLKWLEAYLRYQDLLVKHYGYNVYKNMSKYIIHILNCSRKYNWQNVLVYDMSHRKDVAKSNTFGFAAINSDLRNTILDATAVKVNATRCRRCLSYDHDSVEECPFPGRAAAATARKTGKSVEHEVCNNFNEERCRFAGCRRRHVCKFCHSPMPYRRCTQSCQSRGAVTTSA